MKFRGFAAALVAGAGVLGAFATGATAQDDNVFKLAFVAFLSGPAAESFGKPAVQGAKTVIDALNAGSLPKPYDKVGFGGLKIEVQLIDEAGGATKQVEELRNAFERDHVDAVLGLCQLGRLPGGLAGGRGAQEASGSLRLRHAPHLRGEQIQIRLSHCRPWRDG